MTLARYFYLMFYGPSDISVSISKIKMNVIFFICCWFFSLPIFMWDFMWTHILTFRPLKLQHGRLFSDFSTETVNFSFCQSRHFFVAVSMKICLKKFDPGKLFYFNSRYCIPIISTCKTLDKKISITAYH